jgi:hypothetical protein
MSISGRDWNEHRRLLMERFDLSQHGENEVQDVAAGLPLHRSTHV